jgi:tetratricopeptide (TPR) repeat protein
MELTIEQALHQGVTAHNAGNLHEAERLYKAILQSQPKHPDASHNLGLIVILAYQIETALTLFKTALDANPNIEQFWLSYIDALLKAKRLKDAKHAITKAKKKGFDTKKLEVLLSQSKDLIVSKVTLQAQVKTLQENYQNGRFDDAEKLAMSITHEFPHHQFAWKVLGAIFGQTDRNTEALNANKTAVALGPQDADAYNNLGVTLQDLGRLAEAEASYKQSIALKSDFTKAHFNLGITLRELGKLDEAEASYKQAIALKPDFAEAYFKLGQILYANGDIDCAIESHQKAYEIDSSLRENELLLNVLRSKITRGKKVQNINTVNKRDGELGLNSNVIIQDRGVEAELISHLYKINSSSLDEAPGPRYGNGRCSPDYSLFNNDQFIIKTVKDDLIKIMKLVVKSEVYVFDSFFNIYSAGAGIPKHQHFNKLDKDKYHNLERQKYSLIYYLSVGDQDCSEPGILKLFGPDQDILPCEGMIVIFPASRMHSAIYGGKEDRVLIGANFYSL